MLKISKQTLIAAVVIAAASAPSNAFARPDFEPSQAPARSASVHTTQTQQAKLSALQRTVARRFESTPGGRRSDHSTPECCGSCRGFPIEQFPVGRRRDRRRRNARARRSRGRQLRARTSPPQAPDTRHLKRPSAYQRVTRGIRAAAGPYEAGTAALWAAVRRCQLVLAGVKNSVATCKRFRPRPRPTAPGHWCQKLTTAIRRASGPC